MEAIAHFLGNSRLGEHTAEEGLKRLAEVWGEMGKDEEELRLLMGRKDGSVLRLELGSWAGSEGVQGLGL